MAVRFTHSHSRSQSKPTCKSNIRDALEKQILWRIRPIIRRYPDSWISEVIITPVLSVATRLASKSVEREEAAEHVPSFWQTGLFRLFLSHTHVYKANAHRLKVALRKYSIDAFVAHDDIEPTKEWQLEIERALWTADALAALLTTA